MPKKISRKDARDKGLKRYFTGVSCVHGHRSERNVSTAQCLACMRQKDALRRAGGDPDLKKVKSREKHLKHSYGITIADYMAMAEAQGNRCAICQNIGLDLAVDHCHKSDKVRGLLCIPCNSILGYAKDNEQILQLAINYLTKHS
jgi:hypothetical protein